MNINIVCVGKVKESFYREAIGEYSKRLSRFCNFNIIEVDEFQSNCGDIDKIKNEEGKRILARLKGAAVALDRNGRAVSSEQVAELINNIANMGQSEITFIIGGSYGLSDDVLNKCNSISFGKVTYPHQLMRVILSEQIYRAFMINANCTYHK